MEIKKLNATEAAEIQCDGQLFAYKEDTKMAGKFYRRYVFEGKVFISNDDTFYDELQAGGIHSLKLEPNDEGKLALAGYLTFKKMIGVRSNELRIEALTVENFKPQMVAQPTDYAGLE